MAGMRSDYSSSSLFQLLRVGTLARAIQDCLSWPRVRGELRASFVFENLSLLLLPKMLCNLLALGEAFGQVFFSLHDHC